MANSFGLYAPGVSNGSLNTAKGLFSASGTFTPRAKRESNMTDDEKFNAALEKYFKNGSLERVIYSELKDPYNDSLLYSHAMFALMDPSSPDYTSFKKYIPSLENAEESFLSMYKNLKMTGRLVSKELTNRYNEIQQLREQRKKAQQKGGRRGKKTRRATRKHKHTKKSRRSH
jgi:hypothetical protein